jgi:hypothetical protein
MTLVDPPRTERRIVHALPVGLEDDELDRRPLWQPLLAIVLCAALAALAGLLVGRGEAPPPAPGPVEASGAGFGFMRPAGWRVGGEAPAIAGLPRLGRGSVLLEAPRGSGGFFAVRLPTTLGAALPVELGTRLGAADVRRARVVLRSALSAYAWSGPLAKGRRVVLYAVPLEGATMLAGCDAPTESPTTLAACAEIVDSLDATGAQLSELGPDADYAKALSGGLGELRAAASRGARDLRAARWAAAQERAAGTAAARVERVAKRLAAIDAPAPAARWHAEFAAAVRREAAALGALASAALPPDPAANAAARRAVARHERAAALALRALRSLGYGAA